MDPERFFGRFAGESWPRWARRRFDGARRLAKLPPPPIGGRRFGFIHVGKAGGTSVRMLLEALAETHHEVPAHFGHDWRLVDLRRRYPQMRLAATVRDPLERWASAFEERLRMGGPAYEDPWSPAEAALFAHFATAAEFLAAFVSEDPSQRSAAHFGRANLGHLRLGYVHYFRDVPTIDANLDRLYCVGTVDDMEDFVVRMLAPLGVEPGEVRRLYRPAHVAPSPAAEQLAGISEEQLSALREVLADEYAIYERLVEIARAQRGDAMAMTASS